MDIYKEQELFIGDQQKQYTGDQVEKKENEIEKVDHPEVEITTPHPNDLNVQGQKETTIGFIPKE